MNFGANNIITLKHYKSFIKYLNSPSTWECSKRSNSMLNTKF